jgi:hypothetical protein
MKHETENTRFHFIPIFIWEFIFTLHSNFKKTIIYTRIVNVMDLISIYNNNFIKGKGEAAPLQAWSGPEGSRKLRFPYYMTKAQDSGTVVSLTHRPPLLPGNAPGTHFC